MKYETWELICIEALLWIFRWSNTSVVSWERNKEWLEGSWYENKIDSVRSGGHLKVWSISSPLVRVYKNVTIKYDYSMELRDTCVVCDKVWIVSETRQIAVGLEKLLGIFVLSNHFDVSSVNIVQKILWEHVEFVKLSQKLDGGMLSVKTIGYCWMNWLKQTCRLLMLYWLL